MIFLPPIFYFAGHIMLCYVLALAAKNLNIFIDFCFNDDNILDFYYQFLKQKVKPKHPKLAKILGMCIVCFGFWIATLFFILVNLTAFNFSYWFLYYLIYIGFHQYELIKKL